MSKLLININNNNSPLNNINSIEKEKNKENEENLTLSKSTTEIINKFIRKFKFN